MKKAFLALATVALIVSCDKKEKKESAKVETTKEVKNEPKTNEMKETALKAQDALFKDYNTKEVKARFNEDYIQHNPHVPTGLAPILGFLEPLKQAGTTVKTHRVLQDGDFIVLHNQYDNAQAFGGKELVAFDVWRMENGKVAEHWDNLTAVTLANPSGRTQVDGTTEITDRDKTEANKAVVKGFIDQVLLGGKGDKVAEYINPTKYLQHNSQVADGLEGFGAAMKYFAENGMVMTYEKTHKILGEGNFVLAMSEGKFGKAPGTHVAFYDLFRLEDGKIVEHWDVIQDIPAEMAHENGKF